jgi:hypothetical protein
MWIKKWKELIEWVYKNSNACLFETNGKKLEQQEQIDFLKTIYKKVFVIHEKSLDDKIQIKRKLLFCDN